MSQISLTFPDGNQRSFDPGVTGLAVATSISKSLAKKAIAIALDGELRDLSDTVSNGRIEIVKGLAPGEVVAEDGAGFLSDGAAVTVKAAPETRPATAAARP